MLGVKAPGPVESNPRPTPPLPLRCIPADAAGPRTGLRKGTACTEVVDRQEDCREISEVEDEDERDEVEAGVSGVNACNDACRLENDAAELDDMPCVCTVSFGWRGRRGVLLCV